jgi:molecular chaperone GrpE (heat shock protein)
MLAPNSTGSVIPLSSADKGNSDKLDAAGHSILQLIGKAAGIAEEHTQHVLKAAEQVAHELRAARDHIAQLEEELAASKDRAERAEQWLDKIRQEIDQQFVQRQS